MGSEPEEVGAAISPAYEATLRGMVSALTAAKDAYARHDAVEALRGQADSAIPEMLDTVDALRVSLAAEKSRAENERDELRAENRRLRDVLEWVNNQCPGKCAGACDAALRGEHRDRREEET